MGAYVLDQAGNQKPLYMGSYGIGVERLMAACVEVFGDEKGMVWPLSIAPYAVVITPVGQEPEVQNYALELYKQLQNRAIDVLLDDRDLSPGVKFAESELIGIPYRITVGKKLKQGEVELLTRLSRQVQVVKVEEIVETISQLLFTVNS
jgi:prolyl-tRNA synthetase